MQHHGLLFPFALVAVLACRDAVAPTADSLPDAPAPQGQDELRRMAVTLTIDIRTGTVAQADAPPRPEAAGPSFALLGTREITVTTANFFRSAVGQYSAKKVRVRFDVTITNQLHGASLVTPTFPLPPLGETRLLLFPFAVSQVTGGGSVKPSVDWDGEPFNFFNDYSCPSGSGNDCYRWEGFASPLAAGATTDSRTVGFDVDPTVQTFRTHLVLAADVMDQLPAQHGAVMGTVTSPQRGPLNGVTVSAAGEGQTTTPTTGIYSLAGLTTGAKTVSLAGLPSGCTNPGAQTVVITPGGVTTADFTVTCTPVTATISGSVTTPPDGAGGGAGKLPGATLTLQRQDGTVLATTTTDANSAYSFASVPAGQELTVRVTAVPAGCALPAGQNVTPTSGATTLVNFSVNCTPGTAGTVVGRVTQQDAQGRLVGPLANISVNLNPGSGAQPYSATTDQAGDYTVGVAPGSYTVRAGDFPAGCTTPADQTASVTAGATTTVNFMVTCTAS
jgi:hypothetical protein